MLQRTALALVVLLAACGQSPSGTSSATGGAPGSQGTGGSGTGGTAARTGGSGGTEPSGSGGTSGGTGGTAGSTTPDADVPDTSGPTPEAGPAETAPPADTNTAAEPICPPGPFEAPKPGPQENICPGFNVKYSWNEGPTWVPQQKAFFFSNFMIRAAGPGDMIKYDPATNKCEVFITGNGCNGLTPAPDGSIIATCQTPRALMRYDLTTKMGTKLVDMVEGKMLDSPNDLAIHPNGTIYFSNTIFELGGRQQGLGPALLRRDPQGMVTIIARGGLNPLGVSPDYKRLYAMGGYWDLDADGVPTRKAGNFTLGGDGIGVDCGGNVYTQTGAIISPANQNIGRFPGGTNMAFGGEDRKTLLVVGGKSMHVVKMNLPGMP
jgi:gluconolactonase